GQSNHAKRRREIQLRYVKLEFDLADADFADEGMGAGIAALGRIGERQQKAFVAARQRLQPRVAVEREFERLARYVGDGTSGSGLAIALNHAFLTENIGNARHRRRVRFAQFGLRRLIVVSQRRVEQAMRVVEGWPEQLST